MTDSPVTCPASPPVVSVLMPVYNTEQYVATAIESILNQTLRDFEFIIINDGSTDGSLAIIEKYACEDARIRLISRGNTGYVAALNEGLGQARAPLIARMDSDDISLPERLERQAAYLAAHPDCVAVGCGMMFMDTEGALLYPTHPPESHEAIDGDHIQGKPGAIAHPTVVMRKEPLQSVGRYDEGLMPAEDYDLWLRLAERGHLANLPEVLFQYRIHASSVSFRRRQAQCAATITALNRARDRRGLSPLDQESLLTAILAWPSEEAFFKLNGGWYALMTGNVKTARKYAFTLLKHSPFSWDYWRLFLCALRGH